MRQGLAEAAVGAVVTVAATAVGIAVLSFLSVERHARRAREQKLEQRRRSNA